jgi:amidase
VREYSLAELCHDANAADLATWRDCYLLLMAAEVASCHGAWIEAARPEFGPIASAGFEFVMNIDRTQTRETIARREHYSRQLLRALGPRDLLCLPSAPTIAPLKRTIGRDSDYYRRTLALTSIAGVARLPQVSMPLATASSAPIGLSLIGAHGEDLFLLGVVRALKQEWSQ